MKNRSPELHEYKGKEFLGDALLKFVVGDLYVKKFKNFQTNTHVLKIDLLVSNAILIRIAKKLNLIPNSEDKTENQFKSDKPLANALEVYIYELFNSEGIKAVYDFVEEHFFNDEMIAQIEKLDKVTRKNFHHVDGKRNERHVSRNLI